MWRFPVGWLRLPAQGLQSHFKDYACTWVPWMSRHRNRNKADCQTFGTNTSVRRVLWWKVSFASVCMCVRVCVFVKSIALCRNNGVRLLISMSTTIKIPSFNKNQLYYIDCSNQLNLNSTDLLHTELLIVICTFYLCIKKVHVFILVCII